MSQLLLLNQPTVSMSAVLCWSLLWASLLALGVLLATFRKSKFSISYRFYFQARFVGGILMLGLAVYTLWYTIDLSLSLPAQASRIDSITLPLAIFWVLFPPMWFFTEYYSFDRGLISPPEGTSKKDHLSELRNYAGFASKVWASILALFLFSISQISL